MKEYISSQKYKKLQNKCLIIEFISIPTWFKPKVKEVSPVNKK